MLCRWKIQNVLIVIVNFIIVLILLHRSMPAKWLNAESVMFLRRFGRFWRHALAFQLDTRCWIHFHQRFVRHRWHFGLPPPNRSILQLMPCSCCVDHYRFARQIYTWSADWPQYRLPYRPTWTQRPDDLWFECQMLFVPLRISMPHREHVEQGQWHQQQPV